MISSFTSASQPSFRPQRPLLPSAVMGTLLLVLTEAMFFCALISAYLVIRSHVYGAWVPPGDLRLPVAATAFNSLVLVASGVMMFMAMRNFDRQPKGDRVRTLFAQAMMLGTFFLVFQGYEWVKLAGYGLSMSSSIFGATFFMLIGSHGLHVLGGILAMLYCFLRLRRGNLSAAGLKAMTVFWLFVVGVWPVLYGLVYFA